MTNFGNILVPTDFSDNSLQALEFAQSLAKFSKAILHIIHVVEPILNTEKYWSGDNKEGFEKTRELNAEEDLRRFINKISPKGVKIIEVLKSGKPHEQILKYSIKNNIDLIVIASHGWSGLSHMLTGNVTNKIFHYSEIPTICVKSNNLIFQKDDLTARDDFAENWVG
ncbi:MAG: universal stress protein [Ignavibacteriaceae bacterium]|jgi:nucleotide-binding universal stress UspA family protein